MLRYLHRHQAHRRLGYSCPMTECTCNRRESPLLRRPVARICFWERCAFETNELLAFLERVVGNDIGREVRGRFTTTSAIPFVV